MPPTFTLCFPSTPKSLINEFLVKYETSWSEQVIVHYLPPQMYISSSEALLITDNLHFFFPFFGGVIDNPIFKFAANSAVADLPET